MFIPVITSNGTMKRNSLKMLLKMYFVPCHAVHVKNKRYFYLKYVLNIFYVYFKVIWNSK